ncbi:DsrE family protein [Thioalkalivibrio sp.]|uniref:DsrE family protein n=1 Tax=Thioalkalivibrio sp. TaxID=2093813 RepID=UPI00356851C2
MAPGTSSIFASVILLLFLSVPAQGADSAPWGQAVVDPIDYAPQKVVYDVAQGDLERFERILDRVSFLNNLYEADPFEASIVLVLHGDEIRFFGIENHDEFGELMRRAQSLTVSGPIEFRMCRVAAHERGFDPEDIHGFVRMVPMADAEIIRLQQEEGYVFMQ